MVEMAKRAKTPKVGKPELRFIYSARHLIVLYICVKFSDNISDGIRVMERTRIMEALTDDSQTNTQNFGRNNIIPSPPFCGGHKM